MSTSPLSCLLPSTFPPEVYFTSPCFILKERNHSFRVRAKHSPIRGNKRDLSLSLMLPQGSVQQGNRQVWSDVVTTTMVTALVTSRQEVFEHVHRNRPPSPPVWILCGRELLSYLPPAYSSAALPRSVLSKLRLKISSSILFSIKIVHVWEISPLLI